MRGEQDAQAACSRSAHLINGIKYAKLACVKNANNQWENEMKVMKGEEGEGKGVDSQ